MKIRVTTEGKSVAIDLEKKLGEKVFKAVSCCSYCRQMEWTRGSSRKHW